MDREYRAIDEKDIDQVVEIYRACYGDDYPFKDFYEPTWIKKGVFDDSIEWIVATEGDTVCGTGAVMLEAGDHDDLIGEFGRLAINPDFRKQGLGVSIFNFLSKEAQKNIEFGFAEARTIHLGSQKVLEALDFAAVGYEPMKYHLAHRESFVIYAKLFGHAAKLRNNRILIIPEVEELARHSIRAMGLKEDIGVDTYAGRYSVDPELSTETIDEFLMPRLLKIEFGRVVMPELFGSLHLNYGYFKIKSQNAHYLIAKKGEEAVGAIGYTLDPIDKKMKVFELIAEDEFVKGYLIDELMWFADSAGMIYCEADVSAYSPRIQKTFIAHGFRPIAYLPAMIFQDTERLDIIRFAILSGDHEPGDIFLTEKGKEIQKMVMENKALDEYFGCSTDDVEEEAVHEEEVEQNPE
jgi:GNAT superfamily N-acetyltransferase